LSLYDPDFNRLGQTDNLPLRAGSSDGQHMVNLQSAMKFVSCVRSVESFISTRSERSVTSLYSRSPTQAARVLLLSAVRRRLK